MIMPKKIHEISLYGASSDSFHSFTPQPESEFSKHSKQLPGVQALVECPVKDCRQERQLRKSSLWGLIQHVNDYHKWDRNQMADWLDKLYDDGVVDIAFKEKDNG
jgi:hypothetical protein